MNYHSTEPLFFFFCLFIDVNSIFASPAEISIRFCNTVSSSASDARNLNEMCDSKEMLMNGFDILKNIPSAAGRPAAQHSGGIQLVLYSV